MSPYRQPGARAALAPARRDVFDTVRRLQRAGRRVRGWPSYAGGPACAIVLLCAATAAMWWAPQIIRLVCGWLIGVYLTELTCTTLGYLRAKRVRWLLGRNTPNRQGPA